MSLTGTQIVSNPAGTLKSSYLKIPDGNSLQVLKYIADFTTVTTEVDVNASIPVGYQFNPASQQNFGSARTVRIDTRWMLCPITLSLSDSMADIITIAQGQYLEFPLPGGSGDTFTVLLSPIIPATVANLNFNFGYAKLYFYNYIHVEPLPKNRQSPNLILQTRFLNSAPSSFDFDFLDYSGYSGFPFLKWIEISSQDSNANANSLLTLAFNVLPPIHYDSALSYTWDLGTAVASSDVLNIHADLDVQIPPTNPRPSISNEGKVNDYLYDLTVSIGGAVAGSTYVRIGVAWP